MPLRCKVAAFAFVCSATIKCIFVYFRSENLLLLHPVKQVETSNDARRIYRRVLNETHRCRPAKRYLALGNKTTTTGEVRDLCLRLVHIYVHATQALPK